MVSKRGKSDFIVGGACLVAVAAFAVEGRPIGLGIALVTFAAVVYIKRAIQQAQEAMRDAADNSVKAMKQAFDEMQGEAWNKGREAERRRHTDVQDHRPLAPVADLRPSRKGS